MAPQTWTEEKLQACYEHIKSSTKAQHENYAKFLKSSGREEVNKWKQLAEDLQVELDIESGRIRYANNFKPLDLQVEICYIRHGKTNGNTEPRVYQGMVDYPDNQLNAIGLEQAVSAGDKMEALVQDGKWSLPDMIVSSPLQRARQTAAPYRQNHKDMHFQILPELAEMKFGSWDNVKVADLPAENICHLFYLEQNALVKSKEPHRVCEETWVHPEWLNGETTVQHLLREYNYTFETIVGENFLECMHRQRDALRKVEAIVKDVMSRKNRDEARKPRVVIYGHSMAGAAVSVLLGFGKQDESGWLGFDGSYIMPNATPTILIPEKKEKQQ